MMTVYEKIKRYGVEHAETMDLIDAIVGNRGKGCGRKIVEELPFEGLAALGDTELLQLIKGEMAGEKAKIALAAAVELGKRISEVKWKQTAPDFSTPQAIAGYVMEDMRHLREEHFRGVYLTSKNQLIACKELSIGSLTASLAKAREVFRQALVYNAAAVVIVHNHPSGNPEPSQEDIAVTLRIAEAGQVMEIPVLDHIIIGDGTYVILCERGYL